MCLWGCVFSPKERSYLATKNNISTVLSVICILFCLVCSVVLFSSLYFPPRTPEKVPTPNETLLYLQQKHIRDTKRAILSLVEPLVGPGKARVSVQVQLNLKNAHTKRHLIEPNPDETTTAIQTLENHIQALIEQQHVSVVIDGETKDGVYQARTPQEMEKIRRLIVSAIGYTQARGDTLEIQNMPFVQTPQKKWPQIFETFYWAFVLFLLTLFVLLVCFGCCGRKNDQSEIPDTNPTEYITQNIQRAISVMKNWLYIPVDSRKTDWTSIQKVGIILLALDEQSVRATLVAFDDEEVRMLAKTMTTLGVIPPQQTKQVLTELENAIKSGSAVVGNQARVRQILSDTLDQNTSHLANTLSAEQPTLWKDLSSLPADVVADRLDEYPPENIAYILYHLPAGQAGDILTNISPEKTTQIFIHLSHIGHISNQTNNKMEQKAIEIAHLILDNANKPSGSDKASQILDKLSNTSSGHQVWRNLNEQAPDLAKQMTGKLMHFEDIAHWSDKTIQTLLRYTLRTTALSALIGADPNVIGAISRNVPANVWQKLAQEMDTKRNLSPAQIQAARRTMIQTAQDLLRQGKIYI